MPSSNSTSYKNWTFIGSGASPEDAIITEGVTSHGNQIEAEYAYLELHYGKRHRDWTLNRQSLMRIDDGTPVDALEFTAGDEEHTVYFNLSKTFPE
jgi:hypothetical protein